MLRNPTSSQVLKSLSNFCSISNTVFICCGPSGCLYGVCNWITARISAGAHHWFTEQKWRQFHFSAKYCGKVKQIEIVIHHNQYLCLGSSLKKQMDCECSSPTSIKFTHSMIMIIWTWKSSEFHFHQTSISTIPVYNLPILRIRLKTSISFLCIVVDCTLNKLE